MSVFKCKMCGGTIEFEQGATVGVCDSCGTKQTLPKTDDDIIANLFNRANNLRLKAEFDKAAEIYEKIVQQDDSEAEAHWGIVLCKYGIEYVEDPKTFTRVPTCHRTHFEAITTDPDYLAAIDYSDSFQQTIYEREARRIDRIQKDILAIVKEEKPFDVFICYKETDESGKRTVDSAVANDIYYQLTQEGLKVFYAAITLEDKLGQEYEPYIFAALNSAKVMLVIGTKPEYFNAVWVKNEWSRFLSLMKTDRSKLLIPCYRDMDAYDLPDEFSHLQAQDMGKIGFINDVVRGIKKVTVKEDANAVHPANAPAINAQTTNIAPLLKRAFMFLEDEKWNEANSYCEKVLDQDPENAEAYLGKLMAELRVRNRIQLTDCVKPFDDSDNYRKALRFGDEALEKELRGYIAHINDRNENTHLMRIYQIAKSTMNVAKTEHAFKTAADTFASIPGFKDADTLAAQCLDNAEVCRKDAIYSSAKSKISGEIDLPFAKRVYPYKEAIKLFETIPGWKDADEQILVCQKKIDEIKAKEEADRLEAERKAEEDRAAAEKAAKKRKKAFAIGTSIVAACIAFVIVLTTVIIPKANRNKAYGIYGDVLNNANIGDTITFAKYEQDNNTLNGKEEIEWIVLAKENGKILVISKYALDSQAYNTKFSNITWEECSLRKWLNETFMDDAFDSSEKAIIAKTKVTEDKMTGDSAESGNTIDKVFLLSVKEAGKYYSSDSARQCKPTKYAVANGVHANSEDEYCWWWLRTLDSGKKHASYISIDGLVFYNGNSVSNDSVAVRPAMWINLE